MNLEDELVLQKANDLIERCKVLDRPRVIAKFLSDPSAPLSRYHRDIVLESEHAHVLHDADQARKAAEQARHVEQERRAAHARDRALMETILRPKGIVFRTSLLEELNNHAIDVALKYGITVTTHRDGVKGKAYIEERRIWVSPPTSEVAYSVFLHEVAHCIDPESNPIQHDYRVEKQDDRHTSISPAAELAAWRWASKNALVWTRQMQDRLTSSLRRHSMEATPDQREEMTSVVRSAAFRITDRALSFAELDMTCASLES